jgi:protein ImuB
MMFDDVPTMLWACLLLPRLPLDVFAAARAPSASDPAPPFAVTTGGHYPRIVGADALALAAGIRPGELVSAALALAPGIVLRERDAFAEARALAAVATWATQFSPAISLAPPDAVLVEIGGSLRLFGGLAALLARLREGIRELGYAARWAVAPTAAAALLFARADRPVAITESTALLPALAPLPLELLDIDPRIVAILAGAGIATFGAACALPRAALARRAGTALIAALDHARGIVADPRPPFAPPARYEGRLELAAPVTDTEALAFAVHRLVLELAGWLLGRGLGVIELALTLTHERAGPPQARIPECTARRYASERAGPPQARIPECAARRQSCERAGPPQARIPECTARRYASERAGTPATVVAFALAAPAREPAHLVTVLRERLARVVLPAPVESILLASKLVTPLAARNLGLLPGDHDQATVPLLDRLRARLGEASVTRVAPHPEHRPERASRSSGTAATTGPGAKEKSREQISPGATKGFAPEGAPATADAPLASRRLPSAPRPLWLLEPPRPLRTPPDHRPWVLHDGPERIESGWWDGNDVRRDYFVAESPSGGRIWIYRDGRRGFGEGDGAWFVQGFFA